MRTVVNASYCTGKYNEEDVVIRHYVGNTKKEQMYKSEEYQKYLFMAWAEVLNKKKGESKNGI